MGAVTAAQLCHKTAQPALSPRAALERQAPRPERSAPRKNYTQTSKPQSLAGPEELEKDNDTNRNSTVTRRSPPFIRSDFGPRTCPLIWSSMPAMAIGHRRRRIASSKIGAATRRRRRRRRRRRLEADTGDRRPEAETGGGGGGGGGGLSGSGSGGGGGHLGPLMGDGHREAKKTICRNAFPVNSSGRS